MPSSSRATAPRACKRMTARELARFLGQLAATGNFALACLGVGRAKSGLYKRRARDPVFAARCATALAEFRLKSSPARGGGPPKAVEGAPSSRAVLRATPGTLVLSTHAGLPQLRRAAPGALTQAGAKRFLETLAATANVRFAAASVGLAHSSIYARRRRDHVFAEAMRNALDTGYAALEAALLEAANNAFDNDDPPLHLQGPRSAGCPGDSRAPEGEAWGTAEGGGGASLDSEPADLAGGVDRRHGIHSRDGFEPGVEPAPITPPISFHDALMLLRLHRRQVRDGWATMRKPVEVASPAEVVRALKRRLRTFRVEDVPRDE